MGSELSAETLRLRETKQLGPLWRVGIVTGDNRQRTPLLADLEKELAPSGIEVAHLDEWEGAAVPAVDLVIAGGVGAEVDAARCAVRERVPLLRLRDQAVPAGLGKLLGTARVAEWPLLKVGLAGTEVTLVTSLEIRGVQEELQFESSSGARFSLSGDGDLSLPNPLTRSTGPRPDDPKVVVVELDAKARDIEVRLDDLPLRTKLDSPTTVSVSQTTTSWPTGLGRDFIVSLADEHLGILVSGTTTDGDRTNHALPA